MTREITTTFFLIFAVTFFTSSLTGYTQTLIPQVGVTFSKSSLESKDTSPHATDVSFRTGLVAGMGIELPMTQKLAFQSGLFYIQKGSKSNHIAYDGSLASIHQLEFLHEYISLPLQLKFTFGNTLKHTFYFKFGVDVSYWITGKYSYSFIYDHPKGGTPATGSGEKRMKHSFTQFEVPIGTSDMNSRFDMGLRLGLGVLLNQKISVDLEYTYGFVEIEYFYNEVFATNRVIQLSVGMPLKISRSQ